MPRNVTWVFALANSTPPEVLGGHPLGWFPDNRHIRWGAMAPFRIHLRVVGEKAVFQLRKAAVGSAKLWFGAPRRVPRVV